MARIAFCPVVSARIMLVVFCMTCPVCLTAQAEWSLDTPSWYGPTEKGQGDPVEAFDPLEILVPPLLNGDLNNSGGVADVTSAAPEPTTWMLLLGALFPAFAMRRSRA